MTHPQSRPTSCTLEITPWLLVLLIVALYWPMAKTQLSSTWQGTIIAGAVCALSCTINFLTASWRATPRPNVAMADVMRIAAIKWLGTQLGFAVALFGWWLLADFHNNYYKPFFEVVQAMGLLFPLITAACIFYTEWRVGPADEKNLHMGLLAMGRVREVNWTFIRDDLLGWLVKGIFLPVNFCEFTYILGRLHNMEPALTTGNFVLMHNFVLTALYGIIVGAIVPGYLFSARLFDTQMRAVDSSWFGWTITMVCYSPFVYGVFTAWFNYNPVTPNPIWMKPWAVLAEQTPLLLYLLGAIIVFCEFFHLWGEAIFGNRASNLSHRGIITNGPFRFTKHPVYVAKCFGWLFIWLPFLMGKNFLSDIRLTLCWVGVCGVYYLRAWVEERLLSRDPVYVDYGLWMDKHGTFAFMGRLIPVFSYAWRLEYWRKRGWAK